MRRYLRISGKNTREPYLIARNASRAVHGGGIQWVLGQFAAELQACRHRHYTKADTLLIVVVDADDFPVDERLSHLVAEPPVTTDDPLVALIPRRHIETWLQAALGHAVNESDRYKSREASGGEVQQAASMIHRWVHGSADRPPDSVPSLTRALPHWLRAER